MAERSFHVVFRRYLRASNRKVIVKYLTDKKTWTTNVEKARQWEERHDAEIAAWSYSADVTRLTEYE